MKNFMILLCLVLSFTTKAEVWEYKVHSGSVGVSAGWHPSKESVCHATWLLYDAKNKGTLQDSLYGGRLIERTEGWHVPGPNNGVNNRCRLANWLIHVTDPTVEPYLGDSSHLAYGVREGCGCGLFRDEAGICQPIGTEKWEFVGNKIQYSTLGDFSDRSLCPYETANFHHCSSDTQRGNPISCATGVKTQKETLYQGAGPHALSVKLFYRSHDLNHHAGGYWLTSHDIKMGEDEKVKSKFIEFPNGNRYYFPLKPDTNTYASARPKFGKLLHDKEDNSWIYTYRDITYRFINNRLISKTNLQGFTQTYFYENDRLTKITNHFGQSIQYRYNNGRVDEIATPDGNIYSLNYNSDGLIEQIIYPDNTPLDDQDNPSKRFLYNNSLLTQIIDESGIVYARWQYNENQKAISSEHGEGLEKVELLYIDENTTQITEWVDENQSQITVATIKPILGVNAITQLETTACTDCTLTTETRVYDENLGRVIEHVGIDGIKTSYQWDASRELITRQVVGDGTENPKTIDTVWHPDFRLPRLVTTDTLIIDYVYNSHGQVLTETREDKATGEKRTTTYVYNDQHLLENVDGPRTDVNDMIQYDYDTHGNLTHVINALGHVTEVTKYTDDGKILAMKDANGMETRFTYTPRGSVSSINQQGRLTIYAYDKRELLQTITLPDGQILTYEYDEAHRIRAIENHVGHRIEYVRDFQGNVKRTDVKDPLNVLVHTQRQVFDGLGQLKEQLGNYGQIDRFTYDAKGNVTETEDGLHHITSRSFDSLNRLQHIVDPLQGITAFSYDVEGRLESFQDAENRITTYSYNGFGEIIKTESPDTGVTHFQYDKAGNLDTKIDARGNRIEYTYDALNRLLIIHYPNDSDRHFFYDEGDHALGRLSSVKDGNSEQKFRYTIFGELETVTLNIDGRSYISQYDYNSAGQLETLIYPSGKSQGFTYNAIGQIENVSLNSETLASDIRYLPFGPVGHLTYGNGLELNHIYDLDYRLTDKNNGVQENTYDYSVRNNIISILDTVNHHDKSYHYDALARLAQSEKSFIYNQIGDRITQTHLLAHWDFQDTSSDTAKNLGLADLKATIYPEVERNIPSQHDKAFRFNGMGTSVVLVPNDPMLSQDEGVIEVVLRSDNPGFGGRHLVYKEGAYVIALRDEFLAIYDWGRQRWLSTGVNLADGQWHKVTLKYESGVENGTSVFINDQLVLTQTITIVSHEKDLFIGGGQTENNWNYVGDIDDVKILSHFALVDSNDDSAGNLLHHAGNTFTYNDANRLATADNGHFVTEYAYNANQQRIKKTNINQRVHYVHDVTGHLIAEHDALTGAPLVEYLYLNGERLAVVKQGQVYFVHSNHVGAPIALTDASQNLVWQADYDAFGAVTILQ
ncbi:MAG: RHS domain-containing protein, partial [Pseudomonadota bacterium]